jgi:GTP cyclohydrolase I
VTTAAHPLPDQPTPLGGRPQLQVVNASPAVDLVRAERAVADLLAALGQDPTSEELADAPDGSRPATPNSSPRHRSP